MNEAKPDENAPPAEPEEIDLVDTRPAMRALDETRERTGWSLRDLQDRSGVSVSSLYAWRLGRSPRVDNFVALADALGFDVIMRRAKVDGSA